MNPIQGKHRPKLSGSRWPVQSNQFISAVKLKGRSSFLLKGHSSKIAVKALKPSLIQESRQLASVGGLCKECALLSKC